MRRPFNRFPPLRELFAPPVLDSDESAHLTRLLKIILWALIAAGLLYAVLLSLVSPANSVRFIIQGASVAAGSALLFLFVGRQKLRAASIILTISLWLLFTESARTGGGVLGAAYLGYSVVVVVAGILLGPVGGIISLAGSGIAGLWLLYLEDAGSLPPSEVVNSPFNVWENSLFYFTFILIVQTVSSQTIRRALARSRKELTERRELEAALSVSEERFRRLSNAAFEGVAVTEAGVVREINDQLVRMFGYAHDELIGRNVSDLVAPESRQLVQAMMQVEECGPYEHLCLKNDGSKFPVEVRAITVHEQDRKLRISAIRDITDRKRTEEQLLSSLREKEMLLKEIHHRVKNNLQVVASLLSLQGRDLADVKAQVAFEESRSRVRSMAMVHDKLYREGSISRIDFGQYVNSVAVELHRSLARAGIRCRVEADEIPLGIDLAVPCGLIVNELVSNAMKHAFTSRETGQVVISVRRTGKSTAELRVADDGTGFPEGVDFTRLSSMGISLVLALVDQIGGSIRMERGGGSTFIVSFPLAQQSST